MIRPTDARRPALSALLRAEDGSLTIFGLMIFLLMLTAGGIALDIMRSEVDRTELQYAADRGTLAAAGLDQTRSAEEIVKDYVRAAGLDEDMVEVTSVQNGADRRVSVASQARTDSLFLDLLGVDTLVQPISAEAREVRTELELSLVVDVSGSMGGAKIETLRAAASDFVAKLLQGRENLTTISLVPYNDRVNAGSLVSSAFDMSDEHALSNCVVFPDAAFGTLAMAPGDRLQRMGHFDFRTGATNDAGLVADPNCPTDDYAAILPWSNDAAALQRRIAELDASHWTAMDLGVKWGTLLLDPSSGDELTELATRADVPSEARVDAGFIGRPVDYGSDGTHKVLVVMTDGVNTQQWDLRPDRRDGPSRIFVRREALVDVCVTFDPDEATRYGKDAKGYTVKLPRLDGYTHADAEACAGWHDAGEPEPEGTGGLLTLAVDADLSTGGLPALTVSLGGATVAVNRFGRDGAACEGGTAQQRDLCRVRFDDHEGHRYITRYSLWVEELGYYYVPHRRQYWYGPYGGSAAVELSWSEVFASLSMSYIVNTLLSGAPWDTRVDYFYSWETTHGQARADANLSRICKAARDAGIIVYTIAFQAPPAGEAAMLDCAGAGNESRYFDVEDLDIAAAFDDVLASVSRLRLTQ